MTFTIGLTPPRVAGPRRFKICTALGLRPRVTPRFHHQPLKVCPRPAPLGKLGLRAVGLADTDLAAGPSAVQPARLAVNLAPTPGLAPAPSLLQTVNGVRVGVLGVVDPAVAAAAGAKAEDPVAAARREADRLRKAGAEVVIALAPVDRPVARRLAREAAVDFVVLGRQVGAGAPRADAVGHAFILAPADELQKVGRVDVVLRAGGPLVDAGGAEATELRKAELARDLARLDGELASWAHAGAETGADPAFVAAKRKERDALAAERASLGARPWAPPAAGSYFTNRLVALRRSLPRDPAIAAAMRALDARIGKVNLRAAAPPPPAEPGRPLYVGMDKCASCHKPAVALWRTTVHAHAWKTLVDGGKQADYKCVGCHVTGYGEIGGSSLGYTRRLENVQCETCHGPGSAHVAGKGLEEPPAIRARHTRLRLHGLPQRAPLRHVPVQRLPARHPRPGPRRLGARPPRRRTRRATPCAARPSPRPRRPARRRWRNCRRQTPTGAAPVRSLSSSAGSMLPPLTTHDGAAAADGRGVVEQRGERGRGRGLAHDAERAVGVDDGLADRDLAARARSRGSSRAPCWKVRSLDGALEALGERRTARRRSCTRGPRRASGASRSSPRARRRAA